MASAFQVSKAVSQRTDEIEFRGRRLGEGHREGEYGGAEMRAHTLMGMVFIPKPVEA